jgi:WD40 repeat protein
MVSGEDGQGTSNQMDINENVVVMERSFKNKKAHKGSITHLTKIKDTEFMSCSDDKSFKVWDKDLQGCSYTYETHEPLYQMCVTGEKMNFLVSSLGDGSFFVMGLDERSQCHIYPEAHDEKIVQIVSLGIRPKLQNKYFVTRCIDGDVNVWSANSHPDRVFFLPNVDQEEQSMVQETHREKDSELDK